MKSRVLRILIVPREPSLPLGSHDAWVFRAAPGYYRYRLTLWILTQVLALLGLIAGLVAVSAFLEWVTNPLAVAGLRVAEVFAWIVFLVQLPFSLAVLKLDFELRWYIVSDRSLRIREGILALREKTMTFVNVQNIEVRQNPLQRYLGIADVRVRTAGGGGGAQNGGPTGGSMHEAYFRGVDNPEQIRRTIAERVRLQKDSGLGDPDVARREATTPTLGVSPPLEAATALRREAGLLRAALEQAALP